MYFLTVLKISFVYFFQTYFSKDSSMPSNAPKDTLTDLTSKAYENSTENKQGKISSTPATYSTDLTGNGESAGVQGNI